MDYQYQLVFQWPSGSMKDLDRLLSIEEDLRASIGNLGIVDGHDIGAGEMNVFVHTNEPKMVFEKIVRRLTGVHDLSEMTAGYRDFKEDDYTPIYPPGLAEFTVA